METVLDLTALTWEAVLNNLRYRNYKQGFSGYLTFAAVEGVCFDILGAIEDTIGPDWAYAFYDGDVIVATDADGESSLNMAVVEKLGLDIPVTLGELECTSWGPSLVYWCGANEYDSYNVPRYEVLVYLNDVMQWSIKTIADEIERLGWHIK